MRTDFGYSRTSVLNIKKRIKYAESVSLGKYEILTMQFSKYKSEMEKTFLHYTDYKESPSVNYD